MIDTSIVRVHQHAACIARNRSQSMGRSRGGLPAKSMQWWTRTGFPSVWDLKRGLSARHADHANDQRRPVGVLQSLTPSLRTASLDRSTNTKDGLIIGFSAQTNFKTVEH